MASLKKPSSCPCGSTKSHREYGPERWVCDKCSAIIVSMKPKPDPNICRDCQRSRNEVRFKSGKNQCLDCYNEYMVEWRKDNPKYGAWRKAHAKELHAAVKRAQERSPEAFLKYLLLLTTGRSRETAVEQGKLNSVCLIVEITIDDLLALRVSQNDKCAITKSPMEYKMNSLLSASIDRIDSTKGYIKGNVQLVCQWVNSAKNNYTDAEIKSVLARLDPVAIGRTLKEQYNG